MLNNYWESPIKKLVRKSKILRPINIGGRMRYSIGMACFQMSHFHLPQFQSKLIYQYARPAVSNFFRYQYSTRIPMAPKKETVSSQRIRTEKVLGLEKYNVTAAVSSRPKNERAKYQCGEDAYYIAEDKKSTSLFLSIYDGVGGYVSMGVDPAEYSNLLAESCGEAFKEDSSDLRRAFRKGYDQASMHRIVGGSTAVLARLTPEKNELEILNLGDSKALVFSQEGGKYSMRGETFEQEHFFNCPYQLSYNHHQASGNLSDTPEKADQYSFTNFNKGDVIVLATDGLTDNLFTHEIAEALDEAFATSTEETFAETASTLLIKKAYAKCKNMRSITPFGKKSRGMYPGGKLDDITNIVVYFTKSCNPDDTTPEVNKSAQ